MYSQVNPVSHGRGPRRGRKSTLGAVTLAVAVGLAVGGASGTAAAAPAQPSAAADYDHLALDELDRVVQGSDTVADGFDPTMRRLLTPAGVARAWAAYQGQLGDYQGHGDPEDLTSGELTVVNVPLTMAREPGQFRITFDRDGQVAGLYFLRTGVPTP